jgi:hypothetical protein
LNAFFFTDTNMEVVEAEYQDENLSSNMPPAAEMPEVKLFGRWSCDDVQVPDMSLQVRFLFSLKPCNVAIKQ